MMRLLRTLMAHHSVQLRCGLRDGAYFFTTLLLPAGLYWFFAVPESENDYVASYLICSFAAFSFFGVVFFQYAVDSAQKRRSPWSQYLDTLPSPLGTVILARFMTCCFFALISCGLIYSIGLSQTPSEMTLGEFLTALALLAAGSLPFLLFGMFCGMLFSAEAIVPVANFIYLSFSFVGGLWKPLEILPEFLQSVGRYLPTYHYGMLVWSIPSEQIEIHWENVAFLAGFGLASLLGILLLRRR